VDHGAVAGTTGRRSGEPRAARHQQGRHQAGGQDATGSPHERQTPLARLWFHVG
jgi:hypothetical protein